MLRKKSVLAGSRMREVAVRFRRERDGNIAILFAFMIGVLFLFAGGAVDFTRQNTVRADLVESLDAAGLAIAQLDAMNGPAIRNLSDEAREEYLKNYGRQFFMSNFPHSDMIDQEWGISNFNVDFLITDMTITPKASGRLKTLLLPIGEFLVTGHPANESALAQVSLDAETEITRSRVGNIEVGLVLDITGSMAGSKIADLHDAAKELVDILVLPDQSNFYTKVAIAPYSMAVNVGAYASGARGSIAAGKSITDVTWKDGTAKTITNAAWKSGSAKSISNVETLDPVRVTASNHGFSNGDKIWIQDVVSSGSGSKKLSNKINDDTYTVTSVSGSTFRLSGVDGTGWNGTYSSGGTAQKCATTSCEIVVTANSHGLSTGDYAYVTGVSGMTQINGNIYQVTKLDSNNVILNGAVGTSY
ncbi:MAG: pilus assembly protein TadG-related protein, partial [Amphiplicatus sp.]